MKHTEPAELIRAVRVVAAGDALLSPGVTRRLIAAFVDAPSGPAATVPDRRLVELLTAREREVVALVAEGLVERGDRHSLVRQPGDGAHPRQPGDDQAGAHATGPSWWCSPTATRSATIPTD